MTTGRITCRVCGEALPSGAYFCGECGTRAPDTDASTPPASSDPVSPPVASVLSQDSATAEESHSTAATTGAIHRVVLRFSTGEQAHVSDLARIGRKPSASADGVPEHLIVVSDTTMTVSKNHLDVWVTQDGVDISDLGSANGTVVAVPGEAGVRAVPGQRIRVPFGARVTIGDVFFTINGNE